MDTCKLSIPNKGDPRWKKPTKKLLLGIDHTAIGISDTKTNHQFYGDLLGLKICITKNLKIMSIVASAFTFWINPLQKISLESCCNMIAVATKKTHSGNGTNFNHFAEGILQQTAFLLKTGIECIALLILALAIFKSIQKLPSILKHKNRQEALLSLRLDLGMALALSLEFLLAADIAATAVSPSWDALGKLATISGIRTFLNFFLQKEVKELEAEKSHNSTD